MPDQSAVSVWSAASSRLDFATAPPLLPRLHAGTSGWQYNHWRDRFYPHGLPKTRWFQYYAACFDSVELNNSFYRQPKDATWDHWRDAAPAGFHYAVKANRFLTHIKRFKNIEAPLQRFIRGAEKLGDTLGPLLYQAPPDFRRTDENVERLQAFCRALPSHLCHVLEFRHDSWFTEDTLDLMRENGIALCLHDMRGTHCPFVATSDTVYVRLHGGATGYGGNYDDAALSDLACRLHDVARGAHALWVFFNNDVNAHAPANALRLRQMLASPGFPATKGGTS